MPISVFCQCGAKLNAPDSAAGKRVKCPKCGAALTVPAPVADFEMVDDEDDRPAKRRASRDDDEDEDDRPVRRRSRRDDDEDEDDEDDRPRPKKKTKGKKASPKSNLPLILGIGGGVLVLAVIGVVVLFVLNWTGGGKAVSGPVVPQGGGPGPVVNNPGGRGGPMVAQPNADWEVFDRPEFSIQLPRGGQPAQRNAQAESQANTQFPNAEVWAKPGPTGIAYLMLVLPIPPQIRQEMIRDRAQSLKNFTNGMVTGVPGATVQSNSEVEISGQPGRQLVMNVGPGKSVSRVVIVGDRILVVSTTGPIQSESDPLAKPFFDSFQPK
jgi:hypothetical protein